MAHPALKKSLRRLMSLWLAVLLVAAGVQPIPHAEAATSIDANTIIIDYGNPEYTESGLWQTSGLKGYNNSDTRYGYSDYAYARWTPDLQTGVYRVSVYKIIQGTGETNGKLEVVHAGGIDTQTINHQTGTSGWVVLGDYPFVAGNGGYVQYTRQSLGTATKYARTDAVRFERVGELPSEYETKPPTAQLSKPDSGLSVPVQSGVELIFSKPMNLSTLNKEHIKLQESGSGSVVDAVYSVIGDNVFTLQPTQPLKYEQSYTVTISTYVTDVKGLAVAGDRSWSFTTELPTYIIDDGDPGYTENGTWQISFGVRGYNNTSTRYGSNPGAYAQWTPDLQAGTYRVTLYKTVHASSDNKGQIDVVHYTGTSTTAIDFTAGSPGWVDLGTYYFAGGAQGYVRNTRSGGFARTDAVKFEKIFLIPEAQLDKPNPMEPMEVDTDFNIRFNKLMNAELLTTTRISLRREVDQMQVPITIDVHQAGSGLRIRPDAWLAYGTNYTLTLSDTLTDLEGLSLTGTRSWTFTTKPPDVTPPAASLISADNPGGMKVSSNIAVSFNEAMDPATLHSDHVRLKETQSGQEVAYEATLDPGNRLLTLNPSANLRYGAAYTLTIEPGATDKAGNAIALTSWSLKTLEASNPVKELHVSPQGNDQATGSSTSPFATIRKAQEAVRALNGNMEGDITVYLHEGDYVLNETLHWTADDSGTNGYYVKFVNASGEHPVISGGKPITGWTAAEGSGMWKARFDGQPFRQLYMNGKRAERAKSESLLSALDFNAAKDGFIMKDDVIGNWRNAGQIELSWYKTWRHSRALVQSITPAAEPGTFEVKMKQPYFDWMVTSGYAAHSPNPFGFQIENAMELLNQPGEWYLDTAAQEVYYWPLSGENMETAEVIAPQVQLLAEIKGTLERPVSYLHFEGISFRHGSWIQPSEQGISSIQGDIIAAGLNQRGSLNQGEKITGNVVVNAASHIRLERNRFEHMGAAGLVLENGASEVTVSGNLFTDISAAAVIVGDMNDAYPEDPRQVTRRNTIANNVIYNAANEYWGSAGIFALYVEELSILHNELYDLPYTGISLGWGWTAHHGSGVMKNNLVEGNLIHHHMYRMKDGGGIYTLGKQPGTRIKGNVVHDQFHIYGSVYLDEGSSGIEVTNNVTYNSPSYFHNNSKDSNVIENNYFGVSPSESAEAQLIYAQAGLDPAYRDLLVGLPAPAAKPEDKEETQNPDRTDSVILMNNGPGYSEQGEWSDSGLTGYDGFSSTRYSISGNASAVWRPNLNPGWYKVSVFKLVFANSDPRAKIDIIGAGTAATGHLDQTSGTSGWVNFGTHYFGEGTEGFVRMSRTTVPDDNKFGFARANAVRFEKVSVGPLIDSTGYEAGMDGWERVVGLAELGDDDSRPEGEKQVLALTADAAQPGIAVPEDAIWSPIDAGDYAIGASIRVAAGLEAGLLLRYSNDGVYYSVMLNESAQKLQLFKRQGASSELLAEVGREFEQDWWYRLKAKVAGGNLEVYVDNEREAALSYTDTAASPASSAPGKPGLIVTAGPARYDDVGISAYLAESDLTLASVSATQGIVAGPAAGGSIFTVHLPRSTTEIPVISVLPADEHVNVSVDQASSLNSTALITAVSRDGLSRKQYRVKFLIHADQDSNDTPSDGNTSDKSKSVDGKQGPAMEVVDGVIVMKPERLSQNGAGTASFGLNAETWKKAVEQAPEVPAGMKTIRLELETEPGADNYMQTLPVSALTGSGEEVRIVLATPYATLTLSSQMLQAGGVAGTEVGIRIGQVTPDQLPQGMRVGGGQYPVIDLSVWSGDRRLDWSNRDVPVTVSIPYEPVGGENPDYLTVWYIDDAGSITPVPNGTYNHDTKSVDFRTSHFSQYAVVWVHKQFDDMQTAEWDWARPSVELLASKGIINGDADSEFRPASQVTRSDFIVMLVRALELTGPVGERFADVREGAYYDGALRVARGMGIIEGFEDHSFKADFWMTREDMIVVAVRALRSVKKIPEHSAHGELTLASFLDASRIAPYARNSVAEFVKMGLIEGYDQSIHPQATATRAQSASLIHKLYLYVSP